MANGADKPHYEDNCCGVGLHQLITANIWAGKTDLKTSKMAILKFIGLAPEWSGIYRVIVLYEQIPNMQKSFADGTSRAPQCSLKFGIRFNFNFSSIFGSVFCGFGNSVFWGDTQKSTCGMTPQSQLSCIKWAEEKGEAQSRSGNYNLVYFESH